MLSLSPIGEGVPEAMRNELTVAVYFTTASVGNHSERGRSGGSTVAPRSLRQMGKSHTGNELGGEHAKSCEPPRASFFPVISTKIDYNKNK